jgi:hypothetical protein
MISATSLAPFSGSVCGQFVQSDHFHGIGLGSSLPQFARREHRQTPFHLLKFARYSSENQLKLPIVL